MRRIVLMIAMFLLPAVWAVAQYDSGPNSESTNSTKTIIEGCLTGAIGNYTLTNFAGASYRLTGKTERLKAHVGETVRVTGVFTPVVYVPGSMSEGTETQPSLSVISFRRVSGVCTERNSLP
jgi:hypothetical protein